jgi:hypothetical protein
MKQWIGLALVVVVVSVAAMAAQSRKQVVEVFKSPTCGCCALWVKHLQQNGFDAKVTETEDLAPIKTKLGVPARAQSCHTATVGGYTLEGHVPAAEVQRLLRERPAIRGLAVPGMPFGSPGMEAGSTKQPYDVLAFDQKGGTKVFASYNR